MAYLKSLRTACLHLPALSDCVPLAGDHRVEILIKLGSGEYDRLRTRIPDGSSAHEAIERATKIDYSVGGVLFEGYTILCDEEAACCLQETAARYCPEIVPKIHEAVRLAKSGST